MPLEKEATLFTTIAPQIIAYVSQELANVTIIKQKDDNLNVVNFVTQIDVAVERLITSTIEKHFPEDKILAEEEYADTEITNSGRMWIIDPICGTGNLGRQIRLFATNIALAENGKLIASCVIDHQNHTYYYSTGENKMYQEQTLCDTSKKATGILIEVDLFAAHTRNDLALKQTYAQYVARLYTQTDYALVTYNTSLGFTFAAIGKLDGYVSPHHSIWDVAAPNFLMMQSGGTVTDIDGNPWHLASGTVLAAKDKDVHAKLLEVYANLNK